MKKTIGNLTVRFGADTKQFTSAMRRTQRQTKTLTRQFNGLGRAAITAIGAYASFSFIKKAINAYDQQAKAVKSLEVALGGSTSALERQAASLQKVTRFGDEVAEQLATDPNDIFDSLPRDQKLVLMRMANNDDSPVTQSVGGV